MLYLFHQQLAGDLCLLADILADRGERRYTAAAHGVVIKTYDGKVIRDPVSQGISSRIDVKGTVVRSCEDSGYLLGTGFQHFQDLFHILTGKIDDVLRGKLYPAFSKPGAESLKTVHDKTVSGCFRTDKSQIPVPFGEKVISSQFSSVEIVDAYIGDPPEGTVAVGKNQRNLIVFLDLTDILVKESDENCPGYLPGLETVVDL